MLDVNEIIPPMLADIVRLEPQFPAVLPNTQIAAVLTTLDDGAGEIYEGRERLTPVAFQIDIYGAQLQPVERTAKLVAARLVSRGFNRGSGGGTPEKGLKRKTMSFSAKIDEKTGMIYRR